jgi:pimeloyl-ACP methyl ester carboxylesterase
MSESFTACHRGGSGTPLVLLHGFTDTWRTWDLVLPELEQDHDVLAPTLPCHAGGPALVQPTLEALTDAVEAAMDEAGFGSAHLVGNSLGGHLALRLAARGRATSVLGLAPAGGWPVDDPIRVTIREFFAKMHDRTVRATPRAQEIMSTPEGRRKATQFLTVAYEHIPAELLVHQLIGAANCDVPRVLEYAVDSEWDLNTAAVTCPVRIVWCRNDVLLPWPLTATRYQQEWAPSADWAFIDDCGHLPHLDRPTDTARLVRQWVSTSISAGISSDR